MVYRGEWENVIPLIFFSSPLWFCVHWSLSLLSKVLMIPMGNVVPECLLWFTQLLINRHEYIEHLSREDACILTPLLNKTSCLLLFVHSLQSPLRCVFAKRDKWKPLGVWEGSKDRVHLRNKGRTIGDGPLEGKALSASTAAESSATLCFIPLSYHFFSHHHISSVVPWHFKPYWNSDRMNVTIENICRPEEGFLLCCVFFLLGGYSMLTFSYTWKFILNLSLGLWGCLMLISTVTTIKSR